MTEPHSSRLTAPFLLACLFGAWLGPRAAHACAGDCNGDGVVSIDELVTGVNIALGNDQLVACPSFDANGDGSVTIDEILSAVDALLNRCPAPNAPPVLPAPSVYRTYPG